MNIRILLLIAICVSLCGCGGVSESTLGEILEKDPSFKRTLDAKKRIKEQIASLQREMEPKIEALKAGLEKTYSEYKIKTETLKDFLRKSKSIKKLLAKKEDLALSGDEMSIWNKRAANLEKEIATLKKDLDKLRNKTSLLKTEIKILKE